jgi:hypothetical protein
MPEKSRGVKRLQFACASCMRPFEAFKMSSARSLSLVHMAFSFGRPCVAVDLPPADLGRRLLVPLMRRQQTRLEKYMRDREIKCEGRRVDT